MLLLPLLFASLFSQVLAQASTPDATVNATLAAAQNIRTDNSYGAPIPPWQAGTHPGWYYGNKPPPGLPSFIDKILCEILRLIFKFNVCPVAPPPPPPPPPVSSSASHVTTPPISSTVFSSSTLVSAPISSSAISSTPVVSSSPSIASSQPISSSSEPISSTISAPPSSASVAPSSTPPDSTTFSAPPSSAPVSSTPPATTTCPPDQILSGPGNGGGGSNSGGGGSNGGGGMGPGGGGGGGHDDCGDDTLVPTGFNFTFTNLACSAVAWPPPLYITFGFVDDVAGCATMCNTIPGCIFANSYFDANLNTAPSATGISQLTCTLFSVPLTAANATNCPVGITSSIASSYGFVKAAATVATIVQQ